MNKEVSQEKVEKSLNKLRERELEVFTDYLKSPWKLFFVNFLAGTAKGLGFFVGAAIIIGVLVYVLGHFLSSVPVIGEFFEQAAEFLKQNQPGVN